MYRVLVTDKLSESGLEILKHSNGIEVVVNTELSKPENRAELIAAMQAADGLIIRSATKLKDPELLKDQKRLKVIVRAGVGVDNINLEAATAEGILVMNTPAGNTTSTAEHAIAMMMALSRNIGPAHQSMREGRWDRGKYTGSQVAGKTLGIIGLGRIGLSVAQRAIGLEMRVLGYDPFMSADRAAEFGIELFRDVDSVVNESDYLTVHTPLTDATRGILNAERIEKMKPGVRIINCARGGIVDENDLADALESGKVAGAALDVFVNEPPTDSRLISAPNILLTPHLGASTDEAQEQVAIEAAEIITAYLLQKEVRYPVNMARISGPEMEEMKNFLDLGYRLGLLLAQQNQSHGIKAVKLHYRGEVAGKKTKLITACFAAGLLESSFDETVNMVNAEIIAQQRGIQIVESQSTTVGDFASMITATLETDAGELTAAATVFGYGYLRLVRLGEFQLEAFLDGIQLIFRHLDRPGQIGRVGQILGNHNVNIAHMSLGRELNRAGGNSVAVLHLDDAPSAEAVQEILESPDVTSVEVVKLPRAGQPLPWMIASEA